MTCWRCGRRVARSNGREITWRGPHADWCSMPSGCGHCGWRPHRWWCAVGHVYAWIPSPNSYAVIVKGAA